MTVASWNKGTSVPGDWLCAHVGYRGRCCLIWPFGTSRGYGTLKFNGKK